MSSSLLPRRIAARLLCGVAAASLCAGGALAQTDEHDQETEVEELVVVAGQRETNGDPELLAQAFGDGRGVVIPGCDHFSAIPHALTKAAVFDFIDGVLDDPWAR